MTAPTADPTKLVALRIDLPGRSPGGLEDLAARHLPDGVVAWVGEPSTVYLHVPPAAGGERMADMIDQCVAAIVSGGNADHFDADVAVSSTLTLLTLANVERLEKRAMISRVG